MSEASVVEGASSAVVSDAAAALRAAESRLARACGIEVRERFLRLAWKGTRVRVLEHGEGPPLLHVHGGGAFGAIDLPLAAAMPGRRHILLDRPGFGLSDYVDMRGELRTKSIDLLTATLDALGIDAPVDVVANSFGGGMSVWLALAHPERVRSLALVGACAMIGEVGAPLPFRLLGTPVIGPFLLGLEPPSPKQVRSLWSRFGHDRVSPEMVDVMLKVEQVPTYARAWREILAASVGPFGTRPGLEVSNAELATVKCPIAFAWGDADPTIGWTVGRAIAERLGARFTRIPGAGHMPWTDDAKAVAEAIEPVLAPRAG